MSMPTSDKLRYAIPTIEETPMSNPSEIEYYADRMIGHIRALKDQIRRGDGAAFEKRLMVAMWNDLLREGSRMIEESTGKSDMLNGSFDSVKDDLDEAFFQAIEAEEEAAESLADLHAHRRAIASVSHDRARA
jgi:hypothetical protein